MALQPKNLRLCGLFGTELLHGSGCLGAVEDKVRKLQWNLVRTEVFLDHNQCDVGIIDHLCLATF